MIVLVCLFGAVRALIARVTLHRLLAVSADNDAPDPAGTLSLLAGVGSSRENMASRRLLFSSGACLVIGPRRADGILGNELLRVTRLSRRIAARVAKLTGKQARETRQHAC